MPDKKPRGFAAMSPERRRELASQGGRNVPPEKRQFSINRELAQSAGEKGGKAFSPCSRSKRAQQDTCCFDERGRYRFIYTDHSGQKILCRVSALNDETALQFAKEHQHGLPIEVWKGTRLIDRLPIASVAGSDGSKA